MTIKKPALHDEMHTVSAFVVHALNWYVPDGQLEVHQEHFMSAVGLHAVDIYCWLPYGQTVEHKTHWFIVTE